MSGLNATNAVVVSSPTTKPDFLPDYLPMPTRVAPASGPEEGGTLLSVTGVQFSELYDLR